MSNYKPASRPMPLRVIVLGAAVLMLGAICAAQAAESAKIKFIRLEKEGPIISIAELEVFSGGQNIARTGVATQSSTEFDAGPERAIDGNTNGDFNNGSVTHTNTPDENPWWQLELREPTAVEEIAVWNRIDCCGERMDGVKLTLLDANMRPIAETTLHDVTPTARYKLTKGQLVEVESEPQWVPPSNPRPLETVTALARAQAKDLNDQMPDAKPLTKEAVETFAIARALYREGYFNECQETLGHFWIKHPRTSPEWAEQQESFGIALGSPCCYPALLMLTDAVAWRINEKTLPQPVKATDWNLVALLIGKGSGNMPANEEEAKAGKGVPMATTIRPELLADNSAVLFDIVWLIREYYRAVTFGKISLHFSVVHLSNVTFHLTAPNGPGMLNSDLDKLLSEIPENVVQQADWYWLITPMIEPPQGARNCYVLGSYFAGSNIPGGLTGMWHTDRPLVISPDIGFVRRSTVSIFGPTRRSSSVPTDRLENEIYSPTWMQHEFFHDHFDRNPDLQLEVTSHQWFDRSKWPADFVGSYEADYYQEAVTKRLQQGAKPSWPGYFIHRPGVQVK